MEQEPISKKSQRVRLYFAQTAKEMILEAGIEAVSIRSIAKRAGYAYATIYNHFSSLDELLWLTRSLLITEIGTFIEARAGGRPVAGHADVAALFGAYADYFIAHPPVYRFLYFHSLAKEAKTTQSVVETEAYQEKFMRTFSYLSAAMEPREMETAAKTILYAVHGLLTLSLAENDALSPEAVHGEMNRIIQTLLG